MENFATVLISDIPKTRCTQNWNIGNLRNMPLPSNSDSSYNSSIKTTKIWTEQKTERFQYDLKKKIKISEISKFSILPIYPRLKTRKSQKFCLPRILTLTVAQDLKTPKK